MAPMEMTATSLVPPPTSMTIRPTGSPMATPAPMAAAMGSSMSCTRRAPAERAASSTARRSTSVMPDGAQTTSRGWARRWSRTLRMKWRSICSVTSKSAITPWRSGRVAEIWAGVRPIIRCASAPTATTSPVRSSMATTDGSESTMPRPWTWTTVLAVPRSTAMSRADRSPISDKLASRGGALARCRLRGELSAVRPQRLLLAQREQDPVLGRLVPDVDAHVDDAVQTLEDADRRAGVDVLGQDLVGGHVDEPVGPRRPRRGRLGRPRRALGRDVEGLRRGVRPAQRAVQGHDVRAGALRLRVQYPDLLRHAPSTVAARTRGARRMRRAPEACRGRVVL